MPGKDIPARPAMPGKEIPKTPVKTPVNNVPQQPVQQETPVVEQPAQTQVQIPVAQSIPQPDTESNTRSSTARIPKKAIPSLP